MSKQVEAQMAELNAKIDECNRTIQDLNSSKGRLQHDNSDLTRQLEDAESRLNQFNKERQALMSQLEDAKRSLEDETRVSISRTNSFTTKKQTTKFSSANFKKNVKSMLYHTENSKTRGQTV